MCINKCEHTWGGSGLRLHLWPIAPNVAKLISIIHTVIRKWCKYNRHDRGYNLSFINIWKSWATKIVWWVTDSDLWPNFVKNMPFQLGFRCEHRLKQHWSFWYVSLLRMWVIKNNLPVPITPLGWVQNHWPCCCPGEGWGGRYSFAPSWLDSFSHYLLRSSSSDLDSLSALPKLFKFCMDSALGEVIIWFLEVMRD